MRIGFGIHLFLAFSLSCFASELNSDPLSILYEKYNSQIEKAKSLVEDPNKITGIDRYRLSYSLPYDNMDERIGRVLLAIKTQEEVIQNSFKHTNSSHPSNNAFIEATGIRFAEYGMLKACDDASLRLTKETCLKAAKDFFKIFDIKDAHSGFSGLPFFSIVKEKFHDLQFQERTINFVQELEKLSLMTVKSGKAIETDIYQVALKICENKPKDAIELLGILTSRDVLITRYLKYLKNENLTFARAFGKAPLMIRLASDLDREVRKSTIDMFSYPHDFFKGTATERNYYYWSSALVSQKMKELGYSEEIIKKLNLEFPRQYKTLRFLADGGFLKNSVKRKNFTVESIQAFTISARGSNFALEVPNIKEEVIKTDEVKKLDFFVKALKEKPGLELNAKTKMLYSSLSSEVENTSKVRVLFYDFGRSRIGLSHIKLEINGTIYEIHRNPNEDGSYLRKRSLIASLEDAKPGYLPNGILEIPVTGEQKLSMIQFLESEADATMKYSLFNKLIHNDHYNCGGIIYDALKTAGLNLPELKRTQALSNQIFSQLVTSLPNAILAGDNGGWKNSLKIPNFSAATLSPGSKQPPLLFSKKIGYEFLNAEQSLSETLPFSANKRIMIGKIIPYYSNTGDLPTQYTPKAGNTFELKSVLIPENEIGLLLESKNASEVTKNIIHIEQDGKKYIRFFIHPDETHHYQDLIKKYSTDPIKWISTPSSSARSLLVQDSKQLLDPFVVKVSLTKKMGGSARLIEEEKTVRAVVINDLMEKIKHKSKGLLEKSSKTWSYLPETASILSKDKELGGCIIREIPELTSKNIVLPWYSLVSKRKASETWIHELFRYSGRSSMKDFIWNDLVKPLVEIHSKLSINNGLTTELHQQNVLIKINKDSKKVEGLIIRDMDSHWVDHSVRTNRLKLPPIELSGFEDDAILFRYRRAQKNQILSYADVLRSRNIENMFKGTLSKSDLNEVLKMSDDFIVAEFNQQFPEFKIKNISELSGAWDQLHARYTTVDEAKVYNQNFEKFKSKNNNWKIKLQNYGTNQNLKKLNYESFTPNCKSITPFLKLLFGHPN